MALADALNKGRNASKKNNTKTSNDAEVADLQFLPLEITRIHPDPDQPRKQWEDGELEELAASIEETKGCHTPIKVRPHPTIAGDFMLIYGEGRWRSHTMKDIPLINALIDFSEVDEQTAYDNYYVQVTENISRIPMKRFDEAIAIDKLMKTHKPKKLTQVQMAKKIGKDKTYISRLLKLLFAPVEVQELSTLNITQNLNVLSYLTKAAEFITEQELKNLVDKVANGELGEKALQKKVAQLQDPDPIEPDNKASDVNQIDIDDVPHTSNEYQTDEDYQDDSEGYDSESYTSENDGLDENEPSNNTKTLNESLQGDLLEMESFEVVDGVILLNIKGLEAAVKLTKEDIKAFNESI